MCNKHLKCLFKVVCMIKASRKIMQENETIDIFVSTYCFCSSRQLTINQVHSFQALGSILLV